MKTEWRPVVGFENQYRISSDGQVKSMKRLVPGRIKGFLRKNPERILRPGVDGHGYRFVVLNYSGRKKTRSIHRIVAEAFIGPCPPGKHVNHKNGDRVLNIPENLEYVTPAENVHHSIEVLGNYRHGEYHWKAKLTRQQVEEIRKLYSTQQYTSFDLAKKYSVHRGQISKICNGTSWTR